MAESNAMEGVPHSVPGLIAHLAAPQMRRLARPSGS
jgi:hypothetical protein